jgi:hypothetical protein
MGKFSFKAEEDTLGRDSRPVLALLACPLGRRGAV